MRVRVRGDVVTVTVEHDDGKHDGGEHGEHDGGEQGDGDVVTAHGELQRPPTIPRL